MVQKKKKNKSHGKPTINQEDYKNTMDTLGIDSSYGDMRRPKPISVFTIHCIYRKVMDRSKFSWAKQLKYAGDAYDCRETVLNVVKKLESKYPHWFFSFQHNFVSPDGVSIISKSTEPKQILIDLKEEEENILKHFNKDNKDRTDAHKKKILKEIGADENETTEKPKNKTKKPRKKCA